MRYLAFLSLPLLLSGAFACGDDATPPVDTGVTGDAVVDVGVSDVALTDTGSTLDAELDADPDATSDGARMGVAGEIMCGRNICDAATQECCIVDLGEGKPRATCISSGAMCEGATAVCDGPEDCTDAVCCGQTDDDGNVQITCTDAAECSGLGTGGLELCHDRGDCTESTHLCCPIVRTGFSGMVCSESCVGG